MLKKLFDPNKTEPIENQIAGIFWKAISLGYYAYYKLFANTYTLILEDFHYCDKLNGYQIIFRFNNSSDTLKLQISECTKDKYLINFVSSIDAYILGIVYGMQQHKIVYRESQAIFEHFINYRSPQVNKQLISVCERGFNGFNEEIYLKLKNTGKVTKISPLAIAKSPFLIQELSSADALAIGVASMNCFMGRLCK